jgi:hypothetical protein
MRLRARARLRFELGSTPSVEPGSRRWRPAQAFCLSLEQASLILSPHRAPAPGVVEVATHRSRERSSREPRGPPTHVEGEDADVLIAAVDLADDGHCRVARRVGLLVVDVVGQGEVAVVCRLGQGRVARLEDEVMRPRRWLQRRVHGCEKDGARCARQSERKARRSFGALGWSALKCCGSGMLEAGRASAGRCRSTPQRASLAQVVGGRPAALGAGDVNPDLSLTKTS